MVSGALVETARSECHSEQKPEWKVEYSREALEDLHDEHCGAGVPRRLRDQT
jgi:hypothetical protein